MAFSSIASTLSVLVSCPLSSVSSGLVSDFSLRCDRYRETLGHRYRKGSSYLDVSRFVDVYGFPTSLRVHIGVLTLSVAQFLWRPSFTSPAIRVCSIRQAVPPRAQRGRWLRLLAVKRHQLIKALLFEIASVSSWCEARRLYHDCWANRG